MIIISRYLNEIKLDGKLVINSFLIGFEIFNYFAIFFFLVCTFSVDIEYEGRIVMFIFFVLGPFIINSLLFYLTIKSKKFYSDAYIYSMLFEGDLDGYIFISDIVNIVNKDEYSIINDLNKLVRKQVLHGFIIRVLNGRNQIVLNSTLMNYRCSNCGALLDKRINFAGFCPYCKSSNVYATMINERN